MKTHKKTGEEYLSYPVPFGLRMLANVVMLSLHYKTGRNAIDTLKEVLVEEKDWMGFVAHGVLLIQEALDNGAPTTLGMDWSKCLTDEAIDELVSAYGLEKLAKYGDYSSSNAAKYDFGAVIN